MNGFVVSCMQWRPNVHQIRIILLILCCSKRDNKLEDGVECVLNQCLHFLDILHSTHPSIGSLSHIPSPNTTQALIPVSLTLTTKLDVVGAQENSLNGFSV